MCADRGGAVRSVLDRLDHEDVRLHQPRFLTLPLSDLQAYVDVISPLVDVHLLD